LLARLVLIFGILYDLTAFGGRYFDLLLNGITPDVPLGLGIVLLTLFMTAALLIPVTSLGLDAACGLWLSVTIRQQGFRIALQILVLLVRVTLLMGLAQVMTLFLRADINLPEHLLWQQPALMAAAFAVFGDGGLAYLNLGLYGDVWAKAPWSVLTTVGLVLVVFVQAVLADWLIARAVRRAEGRE
jgi:hypothetical protein